MGDETDRTKDPLHDGSIPCNFMPIKVFSNLTTNENIVSGILYINDKAIPITINIDVFITFT